MNNRPKTYLLRLSFSPTINHKQIEAINTILAEIADLQVSPDSTISTYQISVRGPMKSIDQCQARVLDLSNRLNIPYFRLVDEAANDLRLQAYPVLAELEQDLRAFIHQSMSEVYGFDWWNRIGTKIFPRIDLSKVGPDLHPLALTDFDHLAQLLTANLASWSLEEPLTAAHLLHLMENSTAISELKSHLLERTRMISLWDDVFVFYFGADEAQWKQAKDDLNEIIKFRNKVMHHRYITEGEYQQFLKRTSIIQVLLNSAKTQLSQQELKKVKTLLEELARSLGRTLAAYQAQQSDTMTRLVEQMGPHLQEEALRGVMASTMALVIILNHVRDQLPLLSNPPT